MGYLPFIQALLCSSYLLRKTGTLAFQPLSGKPGRATAATTAATRTTRTTTRTTRTVDTQLFSLQTFQVDVRSEAPRNHHGFAEWATYYGVNMENFDLNVQSGNNWGAKASQPGWAGSRVLFVPSMLRISSKSIREQEFAPLQPMINQLIDATTSNGDINLANHFYLFLKLLQEYEQGDQSPYFSWLDAMPRKFSTAVMFDTFEMDCLPPFVKFLARRDRYNYDLFLQVLLQLNTPSISDATKANTDVTKWVFNIVFTRARASYGEADIIPMSDMLNHDSNPNIDVQYDNEGNVHLVLLRDVQPGDSLSKCYGQPTNPSRFLASYGFFDASPPTTYCKLWPGMLVTQELKNLGFEDQRMVFYVQNGGIAEEVWDVMLYSTLEGIDPSAQQQFYDAHMRGDAQTKAQLHQMYLAYTCSGLLQHVEETLSELADCESQMDQGGMGLAHKNLPMIRRHNDFVRQTFSKVRTNLEQIRGGVQ